MNAQSPPLKTILIVEDEDILRNLIFEALQPHGWWLLTATSGEEAATMAHAPGLRIDMVITDVMMPHVTGTQLVDLLLPRFPNLKVIFMSGFTGQNSPSIQRALEMPGMAFLQKPFRLRALVEQVQGLFGP